VASNFPALPAGTQAVDVILPGVATLPGIPVVNAADRPLGSDLRSHPRATRGATSATILRVAGRPPSGRRPFPSRTS
jgi:hypothetical protein